MVAAHRDDLVAAAAVGLKTAFVPRPGEPEGPPFEADVEAWDFLELLKLMKHLIAGWLTTGAFLFFGDTPAVEVQPRHRSRSASLLFAWILGVILWCAFGVIVAADHLAEMLGEPYGTLILTFSSSPSRSC